jgi:indolepyruvate ferredoxin oxidoreductase beta subunit
MHPDSLCEAIRRDGRAVEANLRGFHLGRNVVTQGAANPERAKAAVRPLRASPPVGLEDLLEGLPAGIHATVSEGLHRLVDFQDRDYARSFAKRVARFVSLPNADDDLLNEMARHLAVRMSSEDTIRVAQLKLRDDRLVRLAGEAKAREGDIVEVTEFLKPGPEEILSVIPIWIGKPLIAASQRLNLSNLSFPLKIRTSGIVGFLLLKTLAGMKPWRPKSLRAEQEKAWVDEWLELVEASLAVNPAAALQVIEAASLVRGYGDTWKRGHASWRRIVDQVVIPMLSGQLPLAHFADALLQARLAAQADPEGHQLDKMVLSLKAMAA